MNPKGVKSKEIGEKFDEITPGEKNNHLEGVKLKMNFEEQAMGFAEDCQNYMKEFSLFACSFTGLPGWGFLFELFI